MIDEKPKSRKLLYLLGGLTALMVVVGLWGTYLMPREEAISVYCGHGKCRGYYHGLGWESEPGFFGRSWVRLEGELGSFIGKSSIKVELTGSEYEPFQCFYPTGELLSEGTCYVRQEAISTGPILHPFRVWNAKYYDKTGKLLSEVSEGNGVQAFDRLPVQLATQQGRVISLRWLNRLGATTSCSTVNEEFGPGTSGLAVGYFPDGELRSVRRRSGTEPCRYSLYEDGTVKSISRGQGNETVKQDFDLGERKLTAREQVELSAIESELMAPYETAEFGSGSVE
ncbi:MAG: hypothetical protein RH917_18815 [Lacipirellulaceae bacterium]